MILISIRRQALKEFRLKKNFSWPFLLFSFCLSGMQHLSCIVKDTTQVESQSFLAPRHLQVCLSSRSNFTYRYFKSIDGANYLLHSLTPDVVSTYSLLTSQILLVFFLDSNLFLLVMFQKYLVIGMVVLYVCFGKNLTLSKF